MEKHGDQNNYQRGISQVDKFCHSHNESWLRKQSWCFIY